jgi:Cof subfamily protein (haloacid dehalogenase superfamily)
MSGPGGVVPFRLIAADLDGTLLRSDGSVSARTRKALARAHAAGLLVVFVTARPPRRVREIALEAGIGGLAICSNGALIYDLATELVVEQTLLEAALACDLVAALRAAAPGVCFAVEAGLRYGQEPGYAVHSPHLEDDGLRYADALDLCAEGVTKLIVLHPTWPLDDLLRVTHRLSGTLASVTHSGAPFVEVAAPGVTKAWALATFCARHAIGPESVIAFGDMPNDLPMLHWAGHSVAVANAHPDVLAAAHQVTRSNDEDGVAVVIDRLIADWGLRIAD